MSRIVGISMFVAGLALLVLAAAAGYCFATPEPVPTIKCAPLTPTQLQRAYALGQIIQSTAIESAGAATIRSRQHHTYLLVPMNTAADTPFTEWYGASKLAARFFRRGSNAETPAALGQEEEYAVKLGPKDSLQLLETGADYELPAPIPARPNYGLGVDEDFQSYKNVEDVVCGIKFLVWSTDYDLNLLRIEQIDEKGSTTSLALDGATQDLLVEAFHEPMLPGRHEAGFVVNWNRPLHPQHTLRVIYKLNRFR